MFRITESKGFHMQFANGWTVSVQFGPGNYGDNYNNSILEFIENRRSTDPKNIESTTAELWCWHATNKELPEKYRAPLGYLSAAAVLACMNEIANWEK